MCSINNIGPISYVLPLENVDLTFLSKYVSNPRLEKIPVWSRKCLDGENEYFHITIVPQTENEGCYSEPSETYTCHICNVHVPIMCSKEHTESTQHETLKNIFENVLQRVAKQINININNNKIINEDVYYCVFCSKLIKKENRKKHELSDYHVKSKEDSNTINDFYKIFKEKRSYDDEKNVASDEKFDESDLESNGFGERNDDDFEKHSLSSLDSDSFYNSVFATNILSELDKMNPEITNNTIKEKKIEQKTEKLEKKSFEEYLKEIINKYKIKVEPPKTDGELIYILAPNGDKLKVTREHFHSYERMNDRMYCQMCKTLTSEDNTHDYTENHVRNIMKTVNEKFCRTIDAHTSHCIPCNEVVLTISNHHTINDNHKKIIKTNLTKNTSKTLCEICNLYIDTHNYNGHTYSKKHMNIVMQQNNIFAINNKELLCKLCDVQLSKTSLKNHLNNKQHVTKKGIEDNTTDAFCKICKVTVPKGGMSIHLAGKPHKKNASKLSVEANEAKSEPVVKDTEVKINTKPKNIAQNGNSSNTTSIANSSPVSGTTSNGHDNASKDIIDKHAEIIEFIDKTKVKCKMCNVNIPNLKRNITEHIDGKTHADVVNKQKIETYNKLLLFIDDSKTVVKCEICDINIPFIQKNILEHMEGRYHVASVSTLLHYHEIVQDPTGYTCKCCGTHTTNFLEHINSYRHTNEFQNKFVIDKNELRKYVYEDVINDAVSRRFRELYRNLLKHNTVIKIDDTKWYCVACSIHLGRISEIDHVLGERHRARKEEMFD